MSCSVDTCFVVAASPYQTEPVPDSGTHTVSITARAVCCVCGASGWAEHDLTIDVDDPPSWLMVRAVTAGVRAAACGTVMHNGERVTLHGRPYIPFRSIFPTTDGST